MRLLMSMFKWATWLEDRQTDIEREKWLLDEGQRHKTLFKTTPPLFESHLPPLHQNSRGLETVPVPF